MFASLKKFYNKNPQTINLVLLIVIVLIGGFFRFYALDQVPPALNQDEAINGYDAYSIANTGRDEHGAWQPQPMLQSFGDWTSPLITFITVPFVKVFGLNVWSVRLPVALLGTASILLLYLLIMQLLKKRSYAMIGAFIWAVSPWAISISRWAIPPSIVPFFTILFLNLFFWALNSRKFGLDTILKFLMAGLVAGILAYSYPTMKLFVPIFVGLICLIYLRTKFKELFLMGLVCLVTILPIFYLTIKDPQIYNARYAQTALSGTGENLVVGFITRYLEYFTPTFAFGFGDPNTMHHVPGFTSMPDFLSIFFYIGIIVVLYNLIKYRKEDYLFDRRKMYVLLAGLFAFPIADALTRDHFMLLRSIHGFIFLTIFAVIGIKFIIDQIASIKAKRLVIGVITLLLIANVIAFFVFYLFSYRYSSRASFNYGLKDTFEYVEANKSAYNKVYVDKDILQIYYLFYSKYDANKLHSKDENDKFNSYDDGKVVFKEITRKDLRNSIAVKTVEDRNMYWYGIFAKDSNLYVVRVLRQR